MHFGLGDYVLDIAQNAVEAGSVAVVVDLDETVDAFRVSVSDDGRGMTAEERARALDPFYTDGTKHVKRKVGLGLPFLVQAVDLAGGRWTIESEKGRGHESRIFLSRCVRGQPPDGGHSLTPPRPALPPRGLRDDSAAQESAGLVRAQAERVFRGDRRP